MTKITSLTAKTTIATTDNIPIVDNDSTATTKKVTWANTIKSIISQAKGNLPASDGTTLGALTVGSNNQVLTADSAQTYGLKWATPATGGQAADMVYPLNVTSGDYTTPSSATASSTASSPVYSQTQSDSTGGGFDASTTQKGGIEFFTGHALVGTSIKTVEWWIKKDSGSTGNIIMKKYNSSGTLTDTGSTIALSSITTSYAFYEATFSAAVTISNGDRIVLQGDAGAGATIISFEFSTPSTVANTNHVVYSGSWSSQSTRDTVLKIYSGDTATAAKVYDASTSTYWQSSSETNPNIYVDLSSARDIASVAINLNTSVTTETAFKIQTSTDAVSWTDQRYISVSDFTNNTWRFFPINRLSTDARYVRIYGQGSSKVLAIYEIKVYYSPTTTDWNRKHYHKYLSKSASDNSLDSN